MTLADMIAAQEKLAADKRVREEAVEAGEALESALQAQYDIKLREWQQDSSTEVFLGLLQHQAEVLDTQAKSLAMLDTDYSLAIRALLIESATLTKVISYARRNTADTKY